MRSSQRPLIQLALDLIDRELIKQFSMYSAKAGIDIIEVGTPAIKRFGSDIVKEVRELIGERQIILADTKTLDASKIEVEIMASAGANIVTVMGFASDETFYEALEAADKNNIEIWADMMYLKDPVERAIQLKEIGVKTVILHVGIDVQKRRGVSGEILVNEVRRVSSQGIRVAVAGGLDPSKGEYLFRNGASVIIIGGWVTKSSDWVNRIDELIKIFNKYR
ncbi:MAG: orotidine 5'-phosphate decarboxylase / HUMPS family protein [Sulfolobales archaeon]